MSNMFKPYIWVMLVATIALMIALVQALPWWGGVGSVVVLTQVFGAWTWVVADMEDRKGKR